MPIKNEVRSFSENSKPERILTKSTPILWDVGKDGDNLHLVAFAINFFFLHRPSGENIRHLGQRLIHHSKERPLVAEEYNFKERNPSCVLDFMVERKDAVFCRREQVAYIQVQMCGLMRAGRDLVDVQIEDVFLQRLRLKAGFLPNLPLCDCQQVAVSIGMAARLQPFVQLGVMDQ